jgi:hypothetical protein
VGITVAPNIVVPGMPVTDSGSSEILETLRAATGSTVAVIDLERGQGGGKPACSCCWPEP